MRRFLFLPKASREIRSNARLLGSPPSPLVLCDVQSQAAAVAAFIVVAAAVVDAKKGFDENNLVYRGDGSPHSHRFDLD